MYAGSQSLRHVADIMRPTVRPIPRPSSWVLVLCNTLHVALFRRAEFAIFTFELTCSARNVMRRPYANTTSLGDGDLESGLFSTLHTVCPDRPSSLRFLGSCGAALPGHLTYCCCVMEDALSCLRGVLHQFRLGRCMRLLLYCKETLPLLWVNSK